MHDVFFCEKWTPQSYYLLLEPALEAVKDGPVVGQVDVHGVVQLHLEQDLSGLLLGHQIAQRGQQEAKGVGGQRSPWMRFDQSVSSNNFSCRILDIKTNNYRIKNIN
jgi:hypothetical protein